LSGCPFLFHKPGQTKIITTPQIIKKGKSYTIALDTITPIQLPASLTQFKRNNSSTVSWVGTAQKAKETVITTLHKTNTTNFHLSYGNGVGATEVLVPQNHLNNFPSGIAAETFIERFVIDSLAQRGKLYL